jgi:hypothetical protein
MAPIYPNLVVTLDRTDEILADLLQEYEKSLRMKAVSPKALQLTHEICEQLRGVLDRIANRYWQLHIAPTLSEEERKKAKIYFPIVNDQNAFDSTMGNWRWKAVRSAHHTLENYLLALQPFVHNRNRWLAVLSELAVQKKHIDLVPQKRMEDQITKVERAGRGSVAWGKGQTGGFLRLGRGGSVELGTGGVIRFGPAGTNFSGNVSAMGAPIDPSTQRIVPTEGVTEKIEVWVSFVIEGHNVNAGSFCREANAQARQIVQEMTDRFELS